MLQEHNDYPEIDHFLNQHLVPKYFFSAFKIHITLFTVKSLLLQDLYTVNDKV